MAIYDTSHKGANRRFTYTVEDAAGTDMDPTTVAVTVQTPELVETTYTYGSDSYPVKSATGIYYIDVSLTSSGWWMLRWLATGTGQTAWETAHYVSPSEF